MKKEVRSLSLARAQLQSAVPVALPAHPGVLLPQPPAPPTPLAQGHGLEVGEGRRVLSETLTLRDRILKLKL